MTWASKQEVASFILVYMDKEKKYEQNMPSAGLLSTAPRYSTVIGSAVRSPTDWSYT